MSKHLNTYNFQITSLVLSAFPVGHMKPWGTQEQLWYYSTMAKSSLNEGNIFGLKFNVFKAYQRQQWSVHWGFALEESGEKALPQSWYGNVAFLHTSRYTLLMYVWFPWPQGLSRLLWMDVVWRQVGGAGRSQTWAVGCRATEVPCCCLARTLWTTHLLQSFPSEDESLQIMERFPNKGKEINPSTSILSGLAESHDTC